MAEKKSNTYAVIKTGGKQYTVTEGQYLNVEKIELEEGKTFDVSEVLLIAVDDKVEVGTPTVKSGKVVVKILEQTKDDKKIVFKYKAKKNYRVKTGHRQKLTKIQIEQISL